MALAPRVRVRVIARVKARATAVAHRSGPLLRVRAIVRARARATAVADLGLGLG